MTSRILHKVSALPVAALVAATILLAIAGVPAAAAEQAVSESPAAVMTEGLTVEQHQQLAGRAQRAAPLGTPARGVPEPGAGLPRPGRDRRDRRGRQVGHAAADRPRQADPPGDGVRPRSRLRVRRAAAGTEGACDTGPRRRLGLGADDQRGGRRSPPAAPSGLFAPRGGRALRLHPRRRGPRALHGDRAGRERRVLGDDGLRVGGDLAAPSVVRGDGGLARRRVVPGHRGRRPHGEVRRPPPRDDRLLRQFELHRRRLVLRRRQADPERLREDGVGLGGLHLHLHRRPAEREATPPRTTSSSPPTTA